MRACVVVTAQSEVSDLQFQLERRCVGQHSHEGSAAGLRRGQGVKGGVESPEGQSRVKNGSPRGSQAPAPGIAQGESVIKC